MASTSGLPTECRTALHGLLGDGRFTEAPALRDRHGRGESYHEGIPPDAVAFPESAEEVAAIVSACVRSGVPVIPFGTGTSAENHVAAPLGGVSVDTSRMDRVVAVHADDGDAVVQPGVTRKRLNQHLRDHGLFFPVDPGADASIGGMASTRASGTNAVRYGTMRENVLALQVVLPSGEIIRVGTRARKSAAGLDLTRLFVGAEGTLGIVTEVTLRLHAIPEAMSSAVCAFPDVGSAVGTAIATLHSGILPARVELLDAAQMAACNAYSKLDAPALPTLFFEFHGSRRAAEDDARRTEEIAGQYGGTGFRWSSSPEERTRLWQARHDVYYAALALRPGCVGWPTDVCVPLSRLAECLAETREDIASSGVTAPISGHVGDGNFHLVMVVDPGNEGEMERARALNERLILRALSMDGTSTGEHGIGIGKRKYMVREHGAGAVALMGRLKGVVDPAGLMNPGKMLPDELVAGERSHGT